MFISINISSADKTKESTCKQTRKLNIVKQCCCCCCWSDNFLLLFFFLQMLFLYSFCPSRMHDMRYHIWGLIGLIHQSAKWPESNISVITDASSIQYHQRDRNYDNNNNLQLQHLWYVDISETTKNQIVPTRGVKLQTFKFFPCLQDRIKQKCSSVNQAKAVLF